MTLGHSRLNAGEQGTRTHPQQARLQRFAGFAGRLRLQSPRRSCSCTPPSFPFPLAHPCLAEKSSGNQWLLLNCLYIFQVLIRPLVTEHIAQSTRVAAIMQLPKNIPGAFTVRPQCQQNVKWRLFASNFKNAALQCQRKHTYGR